MPDYDGTRWKLQEIAREMVGQKTPFQLFAGDELNETLAVSSMTNDIMGRYYDPKVRILVDASHILADLDRAARAKQKGTTAK